MRTRLSRRTLALSAMLPLLTSCGLGRWIANGFKVGPEYEEPEVEVAVDWIDYQDQRLHRTEADLSGWWTTLNDPVLDGLIDEALHQNLGLKASLARVAEVAARLGIVKGEFWPQQQGAFGATSFNRASQNLSPPIADNKFQDWQVGVSATWELDLWGRFRRSIEAAAADLQATQADHDDATVLLLSEVASTYVQYRTFQERLVAARKNITIQEQNYDVTRARFDAGAVTERDVQMAKQVLEQTRAFVPTLEQGRRQANNGLCVLLGMPPVDLSDRLGVDGIVPETPVEVAIGVPAELLRRRPDVRSAERQLAAQSARIGIAESDLYPHLSLTGGLGVEAARASDLFDTPASLFSFVGPTLSWDLLNYGRFESNIAAQQQRFEQLSFRYREAVLQASREAEDAIHGLLRADQRAASVRLSRDAASRALEITFDQYREGTVDFTAVFLFAQTLATQDDALAQARGDNVLSLIAVYRSLGGGWHMPDEQPEAPESGEKP
jgi:NodT family efflux transporter outer membrane factor (OMF) lipoprotein